MIDNRYPFARVLESIFPPSPDDRDAEFSQWCQEDIRRQRYALLWAFYNGTIYQGLYGRSIKEELSLYKNIRPVFSIINRIVEFHVSHIMGGPLASDAGDGKSEPSCLPIIAGKKANKNLSDAIATTWKYSKFARKKSTLVRYGAALGDFAIQLVDDPKKGKIRMRVVRPGEIRDASFDPYGEPVYVKLERIVEDPEDIKGERTCRYGEEIEVVDDDTVTYKTYRDDALYGWPETPGEKTVGQWESDFPFIPLVVGQHIDVDFPFGQAEPTGGIWKSIERDGQGSNVADGAMRTVNGPWLLKGAVMDQSKTLRKASGDWLTNARGEPITVADRESNYSIRRVNMGSKADLPVIECPSADADMKPLIYPVPVADILSFATALGDACGQDYPELQTDITTSSGDASGRALRIARQKAAAKIEERRMAYHELMVTAHKKAIIMGSLLGYDDYRGFAGNSVDDDDLDHSIGATPVFPPDPLEILEVRTAEGTALKTYVEAGLPIKAAMQRMAWAADDIDDVIQMKEQEYQRDSAAEQARIDKLIEQSEAQANAAASGTPPPVAADPGQDPSQQTPDPSTDQGNYQIE